MIWLSSHAHFNAERNTQPAVLFIQTTLKVSLAPAESKPKQAVWCIDTEMQVVVLQATLYR